MSRSLTVLATALALSSFSGCSKESAPKYRGAILITIDTARADHFSCYGYAMPTTPRIDEFAKDAVRFERALVPIPRTTQSLASMMTGIYPQFTGVRNLYDTLEPQYDTLAERLSEAGYKTGAIVEIPFFGVKEGKLVAFGLDQGFGGRFQTDPSPGEWRAEEVTQRALKWLEKNKDERFFLWIHYRDPHAPYWPPEPFKNRFDPGYPKDGKPYTGPLPEYFHYWPVNEKFEMQIPPGSSKEELQDAKEKLKFGDSPLLSPRFVERATALYDGEIAYTDDQIGKLLDGLKRLGLMDEVVTVVSADHGESLGEHDFYFDHGEFLYDTCLHVPLVIRAPGLSKAIDVPDLVGTIDIAPTLLELLGGKPLANIQGRSLVPHFQGAKLPPREYLAESGEPLFPEGNPRFKGLKELPKDPEQRLRAFNTNSRLKLIWDPTSQKIKVFDVSKDPGEKNDLSNDPKIQQQVGSARKELEGLRQIDSGVPPSNMDPEVAEWFRQNGYLLAPVRPPPPPPAQKSKKK